MLLALEVSHLVPLHLSYSRFHRGNSSLISSGCCHLYCNTQDHEYHTENIAPEARTVVNGWGSFGAGSGEGGECDRGGNRTGMKGFNALNITTASEGEARGSTSGSEPSSVNDNAR